MSNRTYNIYFNLHTVSGILITVALFVIFFAGSFTLFMKEIEAWERGGETHAGGQPIDLDRMIRELDKKGYDLYGRNIYIDLQSPSLYLTESEDSLAKGEAKEYKNLQLDKSTYEITEVSKKSSATLGSLLYELHFFYQLGEPGYYLAGLTALFFLFAIISGLIIHWKKIVSKFYLFRPREKLKTVWTDAHTALGTIGLPFQFMYALTGAWFGLGILVATSSSLLYGGDRDKYYNEIYGHEEEPLGSHIKLTDYKLNDFRDSASAKWEGFRLTYISIEKTAASNMKINIYGEVSARSTFFNSGELEFNVVAGTISHLQDPFNKPYEEIMSATIHRLHFGYFGLEGWQHTMVKVLYFLLSVSTCFVIITGVLIWLEARKKKEKRFNSTVGHIYLALCLTMLPVTALSFLTTKLLQGSMYRGTIVNAVFFGGWLLSTILFSLKRNDRFTNKYTLLSAGVLGLCVPLANWAVSGTWWHTVDVLWLMLAGISLITVYRMKAK